MEADLLLLDIKSFDREKAIRLTGFPTDHAWAILDAREKAKKPVWIRHVLVPGITLIDKKSSPDSAEKALEKALKKDAPIDKKNGDSAFATEEEWRAANVELLDGLRRLNDYSCIERVDLLPFHKMGEFKYEELHLPYELKDTEEPSEQVIEWAEKALKEIRADQA